ncbi:glycosyltransferase family 2 protein [bacterium]|nr:glycosyltransferase family 2 protein [candidate division CSSED10-310 bacterium]
MIIVNFNTSALLRQCLESLLAEQDAPLFEVIVIDNNSTDDSKEMLRHQFPDVHLITNSYNAGFAAANNQGLSAADGTFVFLLNPDTIVLKGCLNTLHRHMINHSETALCGPHTWLDQEQTFEICSLKMLTPERARSVFTRLPDSKRSQILKDIWAIDCQLWTSQQPCVVEGIGGAAMFINKQYLLSVGGLDERFFMGYEDTDLCATIQNHSKNIVVVPNAHIIHLFGQAKSLPQAPRKSVYSWQTAPLTFIQKYYGHKASMRFQMQRRLDSVWRRLLPERIFGESVSPRDGGIHLSWTYVPGARYILEISNDYIFFDKFAKVLDEPQITIDMSIFNRLKGFKWYWRAWDVPNGSPSKLLGKGYWCQNEKYKT